MKRGPELRHDFHYSIGGAIEYFRKKKGLSQRKLAKNVKISNAYISMLEKGIRKNIGADLLHEIHLCLNVTCDEIMMKAKELGDGHHDKEG